MRSFTRLNVPLAVLTVALSATSARADLVRGQVTGADSVTLDYVYDSSSNSFALDAQPLFRPKLIAVEHAPIAKDTCDVLNDHFDSSPGGLDSTAIRMMRPPTPISLKVKLASSVASPAYAALVQEDLNERGRQVPLPKNVTRMIRTEVLLGFRWDDRAISVKGKRDLVAEAQGALTRSWKVIEDETGIHAIASDPEALVTMLCDVQSRRLTFSVAYEYQNRFFYYDRANAQPALLRTLKRRLDANARWIDQAAERTDALNSRDARLVATGSLLALELLKMRSSTLLEPGLFMQLHAGLFDTRSVALRATFNDQAAEALADRIGKPVEIAIATIQGVTEL